jgi:hypothetical protein
MRCDRSWSVFVLCVIGRLIAWPSVLYAQEVTDLLNEAHEQYEQSLEEIERDAITRLDELIDQYSDQGNLKKVLELRTQKTRLLEDRNWPESVLFRSMRAKIRSSRVRAKRELADAYDDAIATLTKERRYDDAVALQEELEELIEIQEEFDFRSEEPEQKKPEKDTDDPKPADKSPAKSPVKAKAARPAPPQKQAASKASGSGLAAALAAEASRTSLVDPLATSGQKRDALSKLVETFYGSLPPQKWTPSQFDEFAEFLGNTAAKADGAVLLPQLGSSESPFGYIPATYARGDNIKGYPGMQWLVSSPTPDEFISRATHLRTKDFASAVAEAADADNLKVWFKSIGCNDAKSVAMLIGKFRAAGFNLSAFDVIERELGGTAIGNKLPASKNKELPTNAAGGTPAIDAGREGSNAAAKSDPRVAEAPVPSQELADLVRWGDEREVIANRLSTTQAKKDALDKLLRRASEHFLVTDLTYADCQYLSWLIVVENRRLLNGVVWYPGTPKAVKGGLRWSASRWSGSIESSIPDVQYRFLILWLMGSTSPEQFIERVQVLNDSGELEPSISRLFSEDDLKVWLAAIGCNDREKLSEVLGKLHAAHVEFPAIKKFTGNDGL